MKETFVRKATIEDALSIAKRLRSEDRDECLAASGLDPIVALPASIVDGRDVCVAGIADDGIPEIIWGFDPITNYENYAICWMLSTDRIYEYPVEFVIQSRKIIAEAPFHILTNFMDARNTRHKKWLQWQGFKMLRTIERFGAENRPFIEFALVKEQI